MLDLKLIRESLARAHQGASPFNAIDALAPEVELLLEEVERLRAVLDQVSASTSKWGRPINY